ncbi:MAG: ribonuclease P protein component [Planctomycetota bacterium]
MRPNAYPKRVRLRRRSDFTRVMRRQQKAVGRHLVVLIAPRRSGPARLGVTVGLRVSKSSPRRHQLKRWVVECFRTSLQQRLVSVDLLVVFRRDFPRAGHGHLLAELERLVEPALAAPALWQRGRRPRRRRR